MFFFHDVASFIHMICLLTYLYDLQRQYAIYEQIHVKTQNVLSYPNFNIKVFLIEMTELRQIYVRISFWEWKICLKILC